MAEKTTQEEQRTAKLVVVKAGDSDYEIDDADVVFIPFDDTETDAASAIAKEAKKGDTLVIGLMAGAAGDCEPMDCMDSVFAVSGDADQTDEAFRQIVKCIGDLANGDGLMSLDLDDIRLVLGSKGAASFAVGKGSGEDKATEAAIDALEHPITDADFSDVSIVMLNICGDISLLDANDAVATVQKRLGESATVAFSMGDLEGAEDEMYVTIIATR